MISNSTLSVLRAAFGSIIRVNTSGEYRHATFAEAIAAAASGDVILLPLGTYTGDFAIPAGDAEQFKTWISGSGADLSPPSGGVNQPASFDVTLSSTVTYREPNGSFAAGSDARHCGKMIPKPIGIDTSRPAQFSIVADTDGTSTNNVLWRLDVAQVRLGVQVGSLTTAQQQAAMTPTGMASVPRLVTFTVDLSGLAEGDFIGFTLYRLGATESPANTDAARFYAWSWAGWFWQ